MSIIAISGLDLSIQQIPFIYLSSGDATERTANRTFRRHRLHCSEAISLTVHSNLDGHRPHSPNIPIKYITQSPLLGMIRSFAKRCGGVVHASTPPTQRPGLTLIYLAITLTFYAIPEIVQGPGWWQQPTCVLERRNRTILGSLPCLHSNAFRTKRDLGFQLLQ